MHSMDRLLILLLSCAVCAITAMSVASEEKILMQSEHDFDYLDYLDDERSVAREHGYQYMSKDLGSSQWSKAVLLPQAIAQERAALTSALDVYDLSNPDSFKHIKADYGNKVKAGRSDAFLGYIASQSDDKLLNEIQDIHVTGSTYLGNWSHLDVIFSKANNLQEVVWSANQFISSKLLKTLDSRSHRVRLVHESTFMDWDSYAPDYFPIASVGEEPNHIDKARSRKSLIGSQSLHSMTANIVYGGRESNQEDMDLVTRVMISCPNLRHLTLSFSREGCVVTGENPRGFNFDIEGNFTSLETIDLDSYLFDSLPYGIIDYGRTTESIDSDGTIIRWPWRLLPWFIIYPWRFEIMDLDGMPNMEYTSKDPAPQKRRTNLSIWLERMDWSHVHTLKLSQIYRGDIRMMAPHLSSLRHLTIKDAGRHHAEFLTGLPQPKLEHIELHSVDSAPLDNLIDAIAVYHSTLQTLHLHGGSKYLWYGYGQKPVQEYIHVNINYLAPLKPVISNYLDNKPTPGTNETESNWDTLVLRTLSSFCNFKKLELLIQPSGNSSDTIKALPNPFGPKQTEEFLRWLQGQIAKREPYDPANYDENAHIIPRALEDSRSKNTVLDLFHKLREQKIGESLEEIWVFFQPALEEVSKAEFSGEIEKVRTQVWRCSLVSSADGAATQEVCNGKIWETTEAWRKERAKARSWGAAIDELVMGRRVRF